MREEQYENLQLDCSVAFAGVSCASVDFSHMNTDNRENLQYFSFRLDDIQYGDIVSHGFDAGGFTYRITLERIQTGDNMEEYIEPEREIMGLKEWALPKNIPSVTLSPLKDISPPPISFTFCVFIL